MAAAERAIFEIVVDGAKAKAELASIHQSAGTLGGGIDGVKHGLEKFDAGVRESTKVVRGLGGVLGDTHNQFGEVLNIASDLAGAFTTGGVFAVGMAAGTFVVGELTKAWQASEKEAKAWTDFINERTTKAVDDLLGSIRTLNFEISDFGKTAREKQVADAQAFVEDSKKYAAGWRAQIDQQDQVIEQRQRLLDMADKGHVKIGRSISDVEAEIESAKRLKRAAEEQIRVNERDAELGQQKLGLLQDLQTREDLIDAADKRRDEGKKDAAKHLTYAQADVDTMFRNLFAAQKIERERAQNLTEAIDGLVAAGAKVIGVGNEVLDPYSQYIEDTKDSIQATESWEDTQVDAWMRVSGAIRATADTLKTEWVDGAMGAAQAAASGTSQYIQGLYAADTRIALAQAGDSTAAVMEAEEAKRQAFAQSSAQFLKTIGDQLVGIGVKEIFEGAGMLVAGNPAGGIEMGIGAAAITAGLGMGATGASIGAGSDLAIGMAQIQGGKIDAARKADEQERGVGGRPGHNSRGGAGGTSSGGSTIVYEFNYGVAGPAPDEAARSLAWLERRAGDRGFNDTNVVRGRAP